MSHPCSNHCGSTVYWGLIRRSSMWHFLRVPGTYTPLIWSYDWGMLCKMEVLLMSTHNICFCEEIWKISILLDWKKKTQQNPSYQELSIIQCMNSVIPEPGLSELQIEGVRRKLFFLFLKENVCCEYSLAPVQRQFQWVPKCFFLEK